MKYLEHLAKQAGVGGLCSAWESDRWENDYAERDGRPLPGLAVEWQDDWKAWIATVGKLSSTEFAHPSDAFSWLRNAVAEYAWPICPTCEDTGVERWAVGDVDHDDWCDCWHGDKAKDAKEQADGMRVDWEVQEALSRR
jgi:hypothetical protein